MNMKHSLLFSAALYFIGVDARIAAFLHGDNCLAPTSGIWSIPWQSSRQCVNFTLQSAVQIRHCQP